MNSVEKLTTRKACEMKVSKRIGKFSGRFILIARTILALTLFTALVGVTTVSLSGCNTSKSKGFDEAD